MLWNAAMQFLAGKGVNDSLTTNKLARLVAEKTAAPGDWPEEGLAQDNLVAAASKRLRRIVSRSDECAGWVVPGSRAGGADMLWRDPSANDSP